MKTEEMNNGKEECDCVRHTSLVVCMTGTTIDSGQFLHKLATCTKISEIGQILHNIYPNQYPAKYLEP